MPIYYNLLTESGGIQNYGTSPSGPARGAYRFCKKRHFITRLFNSDNCDMYVKTPSGCQRTCDVMIPAGKKAKDREDAFVQYLARMIQQHGVEEVSIAFSTYSGETKDLIKFSTTRMETPEKTDEPKTRPTYETITMRIEDL